MRYQGYVPISTENISEQGKVKTPWPQDIDFSVTIVCLGLPTWRIDTHKEGKCILNAWLQGGPADFRFGNDEFILRDVENERRPIVMDTYEPNEQFLTSARPWLWVDISYKLVSPPKLLELTVPPVVIDGVVYQLPELRFKYKEKVIVDAFLNW